MIGSIRQNYYFWLLVIATSSFIISGMAFSWHYGRLWLITLWHACQNGVYYLADHLALSWQLIIPIIILVSLIRAGSTIIQQARATRRLVHLFLPLREPLPKRLEIIVAVHNLPVDDVVFLDLRAVHAFCLGFWRPRIWLTAGLIKLLSNEELAAVLAHEVHHYRQRDPLRLLINRALKSAFFFLPVVNDLARAAEIQQEVAADQIAISYLGNDLPLLCALQKLLRQAPHRPNLGNVAVYNPFSITEARLQRLIYPSPPLVWRHYLSSLLVTSGIILMLSSTAFLSSGPSPAHQGEIDACHIIEAPNSSSSDSEGYLLLSFDL